MKVGSSAGVDTAAAVVERSAARKDAGHDIGDSDLSIQPRWGLRSLQQYKNTFPPTWILSLSQSGQAFCSTWNATIS
jgi:hypothetical protein